MEHSLSISKDRSRFTISSIIIALICCCNLLTGIMSQSIISIFIVMLMLLLVFTGDLYLAYPVMIFYYAQLGMVFGVSVYRIYSLAVLFIVFFNERENLKLQLVHLLLFFVYALYSTLVVSTYSIRLAIFDIVDVLCAMTLTNIIRTDEIKLKRFFEVYIAIALCSYVTGIVTGNSVSTQDVFDSEFTVYSRFCATFEDPNYMGFFFSIAIFAVVTLELFSKRTRVLIVLILYAMLLTALSITSIVANILLWCVYFYTRKQFNIRMSIAIIIVIIVTLGLYQYGITHQTSVIGILSARIEQKLGELSDGDVNAATTSRLELSKTHLLYFYKQPLYKQLFGGNLVTSSVIILGDISYSAHNEFVDELLNVGMIGECILMGYAIFRSLELFRNYRQKQKKTELCMFMCKTTWFVYITSLTVFLDYKFMFPYFI